MASLRLGSAVALLFVLACGGDAAPPPATAKVERGRIERIVVATGTIEPAKEVEVRPRIPGIVERIHVEAGDLVEHGQLLVEIERELLAGAGRRGRGGARPRRGSRCTTRRSSSSARRAGASAARSPSSSSTTCGRATRRPARASRRPRRSGDTLRTQLCYARVTSPLAGRVLDVPVEEGNAVSPVTAVTGGTLLLSLAGTERAPSRGPRRRERGRARRGRAAGAAPHRGVRATRVFDGRVQRDRPGRRARAERHLLRGRGRRHRPEADAAAAAHVAATRTS